MKIIDPGHKFQLHVLDAGATPVDSVLTFVKRQSLEQPEKYPGNTSSYPGTILQECWRAEIASLKYLHQQIPHPANLLCLHNLRSCIYYLEIRAARRHGMEFVLHDISAIEDLPICEQCGHIFKHQH